MTMWLQKISDRSVPLSVYAPEAKDWRTCAIGETHDQLPFELKDTSIGCPCDKKLSALGIAFWRAVQRNHRAHALRLYQEIQTRAYRMARRSRRA